MVEHEQVRPLTSSTDRPRNDEEEGPVNLKKTRCRKFFIYFCGCITALVLIIAIVIVILIFTLFRAKDPVIKLNGVTVSQLQLMNNSNIPNPGTNISVIADISAKNPSVASFKFSNTTTTLFYRGIAIGEARAPSGRSKARRTVRMNVSVDIMTDQLMSSPNLSSELGSGLLNLTSNTKVPGRINMLDIFRRHVTVKMTCSTIFNISSMQLQSIKCKQKVHF